MSLPALKYLVVVLSTALALGLAAPAFGVQPDSGTVVVARLYKDFAWQAIASQPLFGDDVSHQSKADLEKYFAPGLVDLLVKNTACEIKYRGICNLDFDLLFDSQDPRVTDLEVSAAAPGKVLVVFTDPVNQEKTRIEFQVARVAGTWKISDIIYRNPQTVSLKKLLSHKIP